MSKKLFKTVLSMLCVISLFACSTPAQTEEVEPTVNPASSTRPALTDPAQPIEVQAGETFQIVIDSNPTTGYHWEIVGDLNGVEFISTEYTADEPILTGSGGVDVWTFTAVSAGEVQIILGSYPPDSTVTEPEQTVTFHIVIK